MSTAQPLMPPPRRGDSTTRRCPEKEEREGGWSSFYTRRPRTGHTAAHVPCGYVGSCCRTGSLKAKPLRAGDHRESQSWGGMGYWQQQQQHHPVHTLPMAAESHSGCWDSPNPLPLTGTQMKWEHSAARVCHHWAPVATSRKQSQWCESHKGWKGTAHRL